MLKTFLPFALALLALTACVSVPSDFRQPGIQLQSITPRASGGVLPAFEIRVLVNNPNRVTLDVEGLRYRLALQGYDIINGVASDVPAIPAWGEAEVVLDARADLLSGLGLLNELLATPGEPVHYAFEAEIDIGRFYPIVELRREGKLELTANP